ncbi:LppU/SCO3897 family protein [Nocardia brasiliensis]|uniref:LppU/SCO3897 family protein n=1 Tax=Nocardia brasiliensis TaxID=37326 RepID=UPI000567051D|nr:hypothetical protein [Nocardia brasiliensis]MBF6124970.1 hypothetical protein [Nocardia brasiliensis]MBF6545378.1 hypothetical protein [Nocardia brasiliensis]
MKFPGARLLARVVLALVAVAAVVVTVVGCSAAKDASKSDTAKAKVGDCINVITGSSTDAKTEPIDCSSEKAVYKVAQSNDKKVECATDYTSYEETLGGGTTAFLCLAPNFKQDACYNESTTTGYKHVACTSSEATFKVVKRIDGEADELLCGTDATSFRLISEAPKITFCLAKPQA